MDLHLTWIQFDELCLEIDTVTKSRPYGPGGITLSSGSKISWDDKGVTLELPTQPQPRGGTPKGQAHQGG